MISRIAVTALLSLVLVGCAAEESSSEKTPTVTTAKSEKKVLRGLQSLSRVQLKISGAFWSNPPKNLHAYAVKQLREQLPQLNTAGSSDDWTLEFVLGSTIVDTHMLSGGPDWVSVGACRFRLFRTVVVNGRFATAVAYEGASSMGQVPMLRNMYGHGHGGSDPKELLLGSITGFAAAWHQANPNSERK